LRENQLCQKYSIDLAIKYYKLVKYTTGRNLIKLDGLQELTGMPLLENVGVNQIFEPMTLKMSPGSCRSGND